MRRNKKMPRREKGSKAEQKLAAAMNDVRKQYSRGELSSNQVARIEQIQGWTWNVYHDAWMKQYDALKVWLALHSNYPARRSTRPRFAAGGGGLPYTEAELGLWVLRQCQAYTGSRMPLLTLEKMELLLALKGFPFPKPKVTWATMFRHLKMHASIPYRRDVHIQSKKQWLPFGLWYADQCAEGGGFYRHGSAKQMSALRNWLRVQISG